MTMINRNIGTSREQRAALNLAGDLFMIDEREFEEILGYISACLEKTNYYNSENKIDGNWAALLNDDPIFYIVGIINYPTTDLELNDKTISVLLSWHTRISIWYNELIELKETQLGLRIGNILSDVLAFQKLQLDHIHKLSVKNTAEKKHPNGTLHSTLPPANHNLVEVLNSYKKVIINIKNISKNYLQTMLFSRRDHTPHSALYVTFALLFKHAQDKINTLSKRHLDFYFRRVLALNCKNGTPVKTIATFELLPSISASLIPCGTLLTAGKLFGSLNDIPFETQKDLVAYPISVEDMQMLFFNSNPYIKTGTGIPVVTNIINNKPQFTGNQIISDTGTGVAIFGVDRLMQFSSNIDDKPLGTIGFIIGSPVLFLSEGAREIDFKFNFNSKSTLILWKLLDDIRKNTQVSLNQAFAEVFNNAFTLSYTGNKDWQIVEKYKIAYNQDENSINIKFTLSPSYPPVDILESKENYQFKWPSVKFTLDQNTPIYAYSFLKDLQIDDVNIKVKVTGVKNMSVYNDISKISPDKPFDVFGPSPTQNSYVLLGKSEYFKKKIDNMKIHINWKSIVEDYGGFDTYYKGYSNTFTNESFKLQVKVLSGGYWLPSDQNKSITYQLFSTQPCLTPDGHYSKVLNHQSTITINNFNIFDITNDYKLQDPLKYTSLSSGGFIKLTLVAPADAFGNQTYMQDFSRISLYNAKNKKPIPYTNKPYVPKANTITIDYEASDYMEFNNQGNKKPLTPDKGALIHINPYTLKNTSSYLPANGNNLLPQYSAEGYLFLGLKGVRAPVTISLFFDFFQAYPSNQDNKAPIKWEFLKNNDWVALSDSEILSDETNGFNKSGIIELLLPFNGANDLINTPGLYYLRLSSLFGASLYPNLRGIYINALEVVCTSTENCVLGKTILAGTIKKIGGSLPDIKMVTQPRDSTSGLETETDSEFYTRVSERLRHKSRAINSWDYERLILQYFRNVRLVKCTNLDKSYSPRPGEVNIIVLSTLWSEKEQHYFNGDELYEISTLLKSKSGPFVNINVTNPIVEQLLVNCIIEFEPDDNGGYYQNLVNQEIIDFLSPLKKMGDKDRGIGGVVIPKLLKTHLENMLCVRSVKSLNIEHLAERDLNKHSLGVYEDDQPVIPATPWSILIPCINNMIVPFSEAITDKVIDPGIGNLVIGYNFIIEEPNSQSEQLQEAVPDLTAETKDVVADKRNDTKHESILVFTYKRLKNE